MSGLVRDRVRRSVPRGFQAVPGAWARVTRRNAAAMAERAAQWAEIERLIERLRIGRLGLIFDSAGCWWRTVDDQRRGREVW